MSTYLITGVAGFIGSHTAAALIDQGHTVVGIDELNDYYDVRLKDHRLNGLLGRSGMELGDDPHRSNFLGNEADFGRFIFLHRDVVDGPAMAELFSRYAFDAVINLAARAGVRYSVEHPEVYASTNVSGAVNLLQATKSSALLFCDAIDRSSHRRLRCMRERRRRFGRTTM